MKYLNVANPYPQPYYEVDMTNVLLAILLISSILFLYVIPKILDWKRKRTKYIGNRKPNGWKYEVPFYRVYCDIHGFYETSLQGWENELRCPKCISERDDKNES